MATKSRQLLDCNAAALRSLAVKAEARAASRLGRLKAQWLKVGAMAGLA
jgi:hypothetical protein